MALPLCIVAMVIAIRANNDEVSHWRHWMYSPLATMDRRLFRLCHHWRQWHQWQDAQFVMTLLPNTAKFITFSKIMLHRKQNTFSNLKLLIVICTITNMTKRIKFLVEDFSYNWRSLIIHVIGQHVIQVILSYKVSKSGCMHLSSQQPWKRVYGLYT